MVLGNNGILNMAKKSADLTNIAVEREYIEQMALSASLSENLGNSIGNKIGEPLSDKSVDNSDWNIIKLIDEEKTYGDGWYYIKKGTNLEGLTTKYGWLVNYGTGEVKQLEEGKYSSVSLGDSVAVKDGLILNIDTAIMDKNKEKWTKEEIEKALGDNVTLHNFDDKDLGTNSGFNSERFLFDGKNDYISIKSNTMLNDLYNNGFTFEFSGICDGGFNDFDDSNNDITLKDNCALFSIAELDERKQSPLAICRWIGQGFY